MATFDYARSEATAQRLIAFFGQDVSLIKKTNTGTAWSPTQTEETTTVKAVDLDEMARDEGQSSGTETRRKLLVSTSAGVTVEKGDKFEIASKQHEIEEVRTLRPGGTTLLYEAFLAR